MTAEFKAIEPGWANIYHNKEQDKVYVEACSGVVTYTETTLEHNNLHMRTKTHMGYASFAADGGWEIAAYRPHYVMTSFLGVGAELSREMYDEVIVPLTTGNLWELQ